MIAEAVYKRLEDAEAITGGDPGQANASLHYAVRPQAYGLPAIVIGVYGGPASHTFKGATGAARGFVRITCLAQTYLGAHDLAELVRDRLDGWHGTAAGVAVKALTLDEDPTDLPTDHRDGDGIPRTYGVEMDFTYSIRKPSPSLN